MYGTENVPFKVWVSQTHLHEKTPHKSHAYAVHIQYHGFSLISRCGPSLYECPRAIFIEKLFVSWLMLYIHTHGFHLLYLPPSHFNSSILKSITMVKGNSMICATIFTPASLLSLSLLLFPPLQLQDAFLFSFSFTQGYVKKTGGYSVIFSIFRTIALALLKNVLFQLMNRHYNTRISVS